MKTIIAVIIALALGAWLGIRWAYAAERRWIVSGNELPF